jgi:ornithine cyclodeaminase
LLLKSETQAAGVLVLAGFALGKLVIKTNIHADPAGGHRVGRSLLTLWDQDTAQPLALIAANVFNAHRTAAGFAAAAKILAPPDAATLTVFGAGRLAAPTIRYLASVRPITRVLIVGRARAAALAAQAVRWPGFAGMTVTACDDPARAAARADIIATVTTADQPVFPGARVQNGALVILGGANRPDAREADDALMGRALIHADHTADALVKAGDLRLALQSGALDPAAIGVEIGALISRDPPVLPPGHVRVFKSIGIAPQDLVLARALLQRAEAMGVGTLLDLDGPP